MGQALITSPEAAGRAQPGQWPCLDAGDLCRAEGTPHLAAGDVFQKAVQARELRRRRKGDRDAVRAEAAGAPDAVHVRRRIVWQVQVSHLPGAR